MFPLVGGDGYIESLNLSGGYFKVISCVLGHGQACTAVVNGEGLAVEGHGSKVITIGVEFKVHGAAKLDGEAFFVPVGYVLSIYAHTAQCTFRTFVHKVETEGNVNIGEEGNNFNLVTFVGGIFVGVVLNLYCNSVDLDFAKCLAIARYAENFAGRIFGVERHLVCTGFQLNGAAIVVNAHVCCLVHNEGEVLELYGTGGYSKGG